MKNSPIYSLVLARGISTGGSVAAIVGLNAYLFQITGNPVWVSVGVGVTAGAQVLLSPLAGVIADRFDRKKVMIISDLIAMSCYVLLIFIDVPVLLVCIALVAAVAEGPFAPASAAALPNLVRNPRELSVAGSKMGTAHNLGGAVGPALGGIIFAFVGAPGLFLVNAVSFLFSALLISRIAASFSRPIAQQKTHLLLGLQEMVRRRPVFLNQLAKSTTGTVYGIYWTAIPLFAYAAGFGSVGYGLLLAAWGGGLSLGSLLSGKRYTPDRLPVFLLGGRLQMATGILIAGAGALAITNENLWFVLAFAAMLLGAIGGGFIEIGDQLLIQWLVPDYMRGQVFAAFAIPAKGLFAISVAASAFVIPAIGPQWTFVLVAMVIYLACIPIVMMKRQTKQIVRSAAHLSSVNFPRQQ